MVGPDRTYTRKVGAEAYVMVITAVIDGMNIKGTCRKLAVPFTKLHMDQICFISNCHVSAKLFKS